MNVAVWMVLADMGSTFKLKGRKGEQVNVNKPRMRARRLENI